MSNIETTFFQAAEKFLQQKSTLINVQNLELEIDAQKDAKYVRDVKKNLFKIVKLPKNFSGKNLTLYRCRVEFTLNKQSQKILTRILGQITNDNNPQSQVVILVHDQAYQALSNKNFGDSTNALLAKVRKQLLIENLTSASQSKINLLDYIPKNYNPKFEKFKKTKAAQQQLTEPVPLKKQEDQVQSNNLKRNFSSFGSFYNEPIVADTKLYNQKKNHLTRGQAYSLLLKLTQSAFDKQSQEINNKVLLQLYNPNVQAQFTHSSIQKLINIHQ